MNIEQIATKAAERIEALAATVEKLREGQSVLTAEFIELAQKSSNFAPYVTAPRDVLAKAIASAPLEALRDRSATRAVMSLAGVPLSAICKSLVTGDGSDVSSSEAGGFAVHDQRSNMIGNDPRRRLSVLDVLPRMLVSSNAFSYSRLQYYVNNAGYQTAEGEAKPETGMPTDLVTAPICTIAHILPASEQVLADVPYLRAFIEGLLRYGVLRKAENEIVAGNTAGKIEGLTEVATAFNPSSTDVTLADAIGEAATALDEDGWSPSLVILHPSDWQSIRAERTADGYVTGGWANPAQPSIWGIPAVTCPALTQGSPLVLDVSQCMVLDRQDARVDFGRSGQDFELNVVRARGEMRIGLAVFSPAAVLKIT